ncbi:TolB-like translocation protein [Winogradskyella tangerina]|uniref:PD40 domain-containing protein n=1 Tax=Winogradskyella tangerina TaxID=2023240 RepID=UPI000DBE3CA9|nr:PD40 domain-containing protein [Winogradskyella tangerina]
MKKIIGALVYFILVTTFSCTKFKDPVIGKYTLEVTELKNVTTGQLEIVGEPDDYFGRITFNANRPRVYEIGLSHKSEDSLHFRLPGNNGFLSLKKQDSLWKGNFKYFGIKAALKAKKIGDPSSELQDLVNLKPLGKGIISTEKEESFPSFDSKNKILYFTRDQKLWSSKFNNNQWQVPEQLSFSQNDNDIAPYVYNNGNSLIFSSNRLLDSSFNKKNIWKVNNSNGIWDTPSALPYPINIDSIGDYHPSIAKNGSIYFISYNRKDGYGRSDIYKAVESNSGMYEVENLGSMINSELSEADVYVDPNEDYILFASTGREDSYGADDIYISFNRDSGWSTPKNLGSKVNSYAYEYGAWVDVENSFLYFNSFRRGTSDIYRIPLSEIDAFNSGK